MKVRDLFSNNPDLTALTQDEDDASHEVDYDGTSPEKIRADVKKIQSMPSQRLSDWEMYLLYGDREGDLELERQEIELLVMRAEVEERMASAAKDRAEAIDRLTPDE